MRLTRFSLRFSPHPPDDRGSLLTPPRCPPIPSAAFPLVLQTLLLVLAGQYVSSIRTPKFGGIWYYAIAA
jgi:hypothetical protein